MHILQQIEALRRIFLKQEAKIKSKLLKAIEKGNDTAYLKKLLAGIQDDIKDLDRFYKAFCFKNIPSIFSNFARKTDAAINLFINKFNLKNKLGLKKTYIVTPVDILADNTYRSLNSITTVIGRRSEDLIREIGLKQTQGIVFGSKSWQEAAALMTKELESKGFFHIDYKLKNGKIRQVPARVYSEMVARTTAMEAANSAVIQRMQERGFDLVDVAGKSSYPNSPCIPYQGTTLSISGQTSGFISLSEAKANGLFHPNCIHSLVFSNKNIAQESNQNS